MREIQDGKSDIVLNNRLLVNVSSTDCAFLHPVSYTDMKYIMLKSPRPTNLLHFHVAQAFDWRTRFAYVATAVGVVIVWNILNLIRAKFMGDSTETGDYFKLSLMVIGIQSSVSLATRRTKQWHQRILIGSLLIFSLITCNSFQGVILKNLSNPKKSENFNTLNELLDNKFNLTALIIDPELFKPNENASNVNQMQLKLYHRQKVDIELSTESLRASGLLYRPKQAVLSEICCEII